MNENGKYTFTISGSAAFDIMLQFKNADNTPYNLTDYNAVMYIRLNPNSNTIYSYLTSNLNGDGSGLNMTPIVQSEIQPKSNGYINVYMSYASHSLFESENAYYSLSLLSATGSIKILEGRILKI